MTIRGKIVSSIPLPERCPSAEVFSSFTPSASSIKFKLN